MHTGIISFCDRIGFNIKCPDTKEAILSHLEQRYKIRIIQKHWFDFNDAQVSYVSKIPHVVSIRSNGNPYYLYFTRYEGVNQVMYIDKKIQPGYQRPRIILSRGRFDNSLFDNTLLEGEMVKDNRQQWLFVINDILIYKGQSLQEKLLPERLQSIFELLQYNYTSDPIMDVCRFQIKRYVPVTQEDIEDLLTFSKQLPYTSRGLYFYPFSLKYKPKLINFDMNAVKSVVRKVKDTAGYIETTPTVVTPEPEQPPLPPPAPPPIPVPEENTTLQLWLRKTDQPDIYDMFQNETTMQKMGIASVPGLQTSKMLRTIFKNLNVATPVEFRCRLDPAFNNWIPLEKV